MLNTDHPLSTTDWNDRRARNLKKLSPLLYMMVLFVSRSAHTELRDLQCHETGKHVLKTQV